MIPHRKVTFMAKNETKPKTPKKTDTAKSAKAAQPRKTSPPKPSGTKQVKKSTAPKKTAGEKTPAAKKSRKTIAQRKSDWATGRPLFLLRWLAMLPLGGIWYIFTYLMAGYSFTAFVCACLIGVLLFYNLCYLTKHKFPKTTRVVKCLFTFLLVIGLLVVGVTECLIIEASFGDTDASFEYLVVLGAKVRNDGPSVSLMDRIRATADYLAAHPDVIAIVSGGQGTDEPMTEARCMYEELVRLGVDPHRIWLEEKATSTWENLRFSLDLIEAKTGIRPEKIGLLSSEYHLFRAKLFAQACGVDAAGIPAHTSRISQMINHFMREVAGVWHYILLGGQYHD